MLSNLIFGQKSRKKTKKIETFATCQDIRVANRDSSSPKSKHEWSVAATWSNLLHFNGLKQLLSFGCLSSLFVAPHPPSDPIGDPFESSCFFSQIFASLLLITQPETQREHKRIRRMRALNSHLVLIDLHSSWHSANQVPTSTVAYLRNSNFISTVSSSFRRTLRARTGIASSSKSEAPEIRKPSDRFVLGNGSPQSSQNSASTSRSELELFLELLPVRMKRELCGHEEVRKLIEVVMDLGRKPLARFPSGDWVILEEPVKHEDLRHAISKVIKVILCCFLGTFLWRLTECD
jgi:hypothetical protein